MGLNISLISEEPLNDGEGDFENLPQDESEVLEGKEDVKMET